ncbi:MAG: hypothetical protein WDO12_07860 [Pseudomonadota bacterium]
MNAHRRYALALFVAAMGTQGARPQEAQGFRVDIDSSRMTAKAHEAVHYRCGAPRNDTPYDIDVHSPVDVAQGLGKFAVNATKDGGWIPRHATFTAPDAFIIDRHFGNTHVIGAVIANGDSTYDVDLTQAGVVTATQTGTTNKLTNLKFAFPLTGTVKWKATETVDLNAGTDKWDLQAEIDATYKTSGFSPSCTFTGTLDSHATSMRAIKLPPQVVKR